MDYITLMNGAKELNRRQKAKRNKIADSISEMINANKVLKQRILYLELRQGLIARSVTVK